MKMLNQLSASIEFWENNFNCRLQKFTSMKKIGFGVLIVLLVGLGYSCNNDSDGYSLNDIWITIGNIEGDSEDYIIVTDGGTRLFPSATAVPDYGFEDGDRLFINFTILADGSEGSGIDHYIKLNGYSEILTKDIIEYNPENADSIGNDPLWISNQNDDVWIANDYLNVNFVYEGAPWITHYINLVYDVDNLTTEDGTPIYEIKHNKNDDEYTSPPLRGFVSFDLKDIQEPGKTEIKFIVRAIGKSGEYEFDKEFTYNYSSPEVEAMTKLEFFEDLQFRLE